MANVLLITESTGQAIDEAYGGWRGRFHQHQWQTRHEPWVPVGRTHRPEFPAWGHYEAIPNGTAAAALADLDDVFAALSEPPDLVIVSLGINDGVQASFTIPTLPDTYTMTDTMTALVLGIHARASGVPILVTPIPVCVQDANQTTWASLWNLYLPRALNNAREAGANVWLMDIWAQLNAHRDGQTNDWLADGIHPNTTGYEHAAEDAIAWFDAHRAELGL